MSDKGKLFLDQEMYYPGQTISGRVEVYFSSSKKTRGIYVKFKGFAYTYWSSDDTSYSEREEYFKTRTELTQIQDNDKELPAGNHSFPFTFILPYNSPSTLKKRSGYIKYFAKAVVELPWQINLDDRIKFSVGPYLDLNTCECLKEPVIKTEEKIPLSSESPIRFTVQLPVSGFVPSQIINVNASVKNMSNTKTTGIQFKIVQIFEYRAQKSVEKEQITLLKSFKVKDSAVPSASEKMWNLQLQLPADMVVPNLECCKIIKTFCELRGKVLLAFPHMDLRLTIPFSIGHVPIQQGAPPMGFNLSEQLCAIPKK